MAVPHLGDTPFPETERLGMGVVDAEDLHAVRDPEEEDVAKRRPQPPPVGALEVERVDVLILLRRILGVLDRSVRPVLEPVGVLAYPGMIRRGLKRDVEGDLEAETIRDANESIEVLDCAQPRLDGRMAAGLRADSPR